MGVKPLAKMPVKERAKQFMPFSALKGLEDAIYKKEQQRLKVPKKILSEEQYEILNQTMREINEGEQIEICYYRNGKYHTCSGILETVDKQASHLTINGKEIMFNEVYNIKIL